MEYLLGRVRWARERWMDVALGCVDVQVQVGRPV